VPNVELLLAARSEPSTSMPEDVDIWVGCDW
jgi:hypothetical protein